MDIFKLYTLDEEHNRETIMCNNAEIYNKHLFTIEYLCKDKLPFYTFLLEKYCEETGVYEEMRKYKQKECFFKGKRNADEIYYTRISTIGKYRIRIAENGECFYLKIQ